MNLETTCRTCLAQDRKLHALDDCKILLKLVPDSLTCVPTLVRCCWECISVLRNVRSFTRRAQKSADILKAWTQQQLGENLTSNRSDLSNLTCDTNSRVIDHLPASETKYIPKTNINFESVKEIETIHLKCDIKDTDVAVKQEDIEIEDDIPLMQYEEQQFESSLPEEKRGTTEDADVARIDFTAQTDDTVGKTLRKFRSTTHLKMSDAASLDSASQHHCVTCKEIFKSSSELQWHRSEAHSTELPCPECGKLCFSKTGLSAHMRVHKLKPVNCLICHKTCENNFKLRGHMKTHETAGETFFCRECDVHLKSAALLRAHVKSSLKHVDSQQLKFACDMCGKKFLTENRLKLHCNAVHFNVKKFFCADCNKAYANKPSLRSHIQDVHLKKEKKRDKICHVCGKGFHNNVLLKNHIRGHTGERSFHCKLCTSTFNYSAALYTHNRLVHQHLKKKKKKKEETID